MRGLILMCVAVSALAASQMGGSIAGTWACLSMSAGAYTGRSCRLEPWLRLKANKTYEWGREKGAWEYSKGVLSLSERTGRGSLSTDGKLIIEYDLNARHYVLTFYKRQQ